MIVSYETLRTLGPYLVNCHIGLLLCDEGHRLKNSGERCAPQHILMLMTMHAADSLTFQALNALNVQRRVILSGTPIQVRIQRPLMIILRPTPTPLLILE